MFHPKSIIIAIALYSIASPPVTAGSRHDILTEKRDPECRVVNEAYKNSRRSAVYREFITSVGTTSSRTMLETRVTDEGAFAKLGAHHLNRWKKMDAPPPAITDPLRYKYCVYIDGIDGPHFEALWNAPPQTAHAEVWLTRDYKKLAEVRRHFPESDPDYPKQTLISIFEYGPSKVDVPAPDTVVQ